MLLNLVLNIVKKRVLYFILGILLLMLGLGYAVKLSYNLRLYRAAMEPGVSVTDSALSDLNSFHQQDFDGVCGKYIEGDSCKKTFNVVKFESRMEKAALNPACARGIRDHIYNTFFLAAVFGLFGVVFTGVVVACDFYLSDTSEFMEVYN